jgi:hypothetical protein
MQQGLEQNKNEYWLVVTLLVVIEWDFTIKSFEIEDYDIYFKDITYLKYSLEARALEEFDARVKPEEFQRCHAIKVMFNYISELFRKMNVRNTMQS